jgi:hypothetical protein
VAFFGKLEESLRDVISTFLAKVKTWPCLHQIYEQRENARAESKNQYQKGSALQQSTSKHRIKTKKGVGKLPQLAHTITDTID